MTEPGPEAAPAVEPVPPPAPPSPGAMLRQARERAGLGADDLAGQLKLAKGTLEALERDDFKTLSEPVYVRGYYRKIAKVLPVAEAELINAYNARTQPKPATAAQQLRRLPLAGGVAAGTSRHSQGPGVGTILVVIAVLGILIALATREPTPRLAATGSAERARPPAPPQPQPEPTTALETPASDVATAPAVQAPVEHSPADTAPATAPASSPGQLVLEVSEPSYVRVEDSRNKTLAIGLVRERQAYDGAPPYTVFIGNAGNVKVFYGGAPVDFSAHVDTQNDTARFTVP
ncbi:MAG: helix-turn-helix domain-containing protein [Gammaproteobacteria bacterium]